MTNQIDPNAFLMGTGGRSAKFEAEGDVAVGYITHYEMRQQTDIKTGAPKTWDDGNPMMQLVVTIDTETREDEDDDGVRTVYIKGQMQKAVSDAIRKAGEHGLGIGGKLGIKYVSTAAPKQRGFNGAKQYSAKYEPPTVGVDDSDFESVESADPF